VYDVKDDQEGFVGRWKEILEDILELPEALISINLDFYTYGNCFLSVRYPITKMYTCLACNYTAKFSSLPKYEIKENNLSIELCPNCGTLYPTIEIKDVPLKDKSRMRLVRWDPNLIGIRYSHITGESKYEYAIPPGDRNSILAKTLTVEEISKIEQIYITAALSENQKIVVFSDKSIFHMKAPSIAGVDSAWGFPLIMSLTKDLYYMQTLKKANEAVMLGHMVPYRYVFPTSPPDATIPFGGINLAIWRTFMRQELARYRKDPNYISVFPFQVGQGMFGGQGKALLAQAELNEMSKYILAGLGVPQEFIFGGLQWSGTNLSLRMLENEFLRLRKMNLKLIRFIIERVAACQEMPPIKVHFSEFKMADDAQRKQFLVNLNQTGHVSADTMLDEFGLDADDEIQKRMKEVNDIAELRKRELLAQGKAEVEAEIQRNRLMNKYNQELMDQQAMAGQQGAGLELLGQEGAGAAGSTQSKTQGAPQAQQQPQNALPQKQDQQARQVAPTKPATNNPEQKPPRSPSSQT
jgi:hypothetical protein